MKRSYLSDLSNFCFIFILKCSMVTLKYYCGITGFFSPPDPRSEIQKGSYSSGFLGLSCDFFILFLLLTCFLPPSSCSCVSESPLVSTGFCSLICLRLNKRRCWKCRYEGSTTIDSGIHSFPIGQIFDSFLFK